MRRLLQFSWFLFIVACQNEESAHAFIDESINTIQKKYAPDKRTSIFNVHYSSENGTIVIKGETNHAEAKTELLTRLVSLNCLDSIEVLPSKSLENKLFGVVTIPVANMRTSPAHSSELANQLLCGTVVRNYNTSNGWFYCQTPDDYLGWIDQDAIQPMDSSQLNVWLSRNKIMVTQDQTYLLASPSKSAQVLSALSGGTILASGEDRKNFYEAYLPDGRSGFIPAEHAKDFRLWKIQHSGSKSQEDILKTANAYLGRPYLWGGTSGNGMDCSGFTKMIFLQHGLLLPRDASQQVKVGMPVETDTTLKNIIPGDFLFFGREASDSLPEKITHVAIYLGQGKIIHASGFVRIQSLVRGDSDFVEHRLKTLVRATRPLAAPGEHGIPSLANLKYFN